MINIEHKIRNSFFILLSGCWVAIAGWPCQTAYGQQLEIELKSPSVNCFDDTIHINDVAEIRTSDSRLRKQVGKLDLDSFTDKQKQVEISDRLIHYRLLVAGLNPSQFRIVGGPRTIASFSEPINASQAIEHAIQRKLAAQFQLPPDSLEVSVNHEIESALQRTELDLTTLIVEPDFPAELPIGNRNIEVVLSDKTGNSLATKVSAKIAVYRDLVIAKQNISRGELLSEDKIERVRRPVDTQQVRFASFEQAVGHTAQSDIQQFALLKTQFISSSNPSGQNPSYLVKRNDRLNIVINRGRISITLKDARAMENGRVGDYIEFINPKSGNRVRRGSSTQVMR